MPRPIEKQKDLLKRMNAELDKYEKMFMNDGILDSDEQAQIKAMKADIARLEATINAKLAEEQGDTALQQSGEQSIDGVVPSGKDFKGAKEIDLTKVKKITKLFAEGTTDEYGDGISHDDVDQNWIGDCFFLSALAAVAKANPAAIEKLIDGPKSDGSYDVKLYVNGNKLSGGKPTVVNVFPKTLESSDGRTTSGIGDGELWVLLVERAFAKTQGGYDVINKGGHADDALEILTGDDAVVKKLNTMTNEQLITFVQGRLDAKKPLTTSSISAKEGSKKEIAAGSVNVHTNHAYYVISISKKDITVRNPHNNSTAGGREVTLSFEDYRKFFYKISYVK